MSHELTRSTHFRNKIQAVFRQDQEEAIPKRTGPVPCSVPSLQMLRVDHKIDTPANVLVVEDDANTRAFIVMTLERDGHSVVEAATLAAGSELIRSEAWDLLLLDLRLRDGLGSDLISTTRQRCAHTPILILTGFGTSKDEIDSLDRGADDFICKPVGGDALRARVRSLIGQGRLRRQLSDTNRFYQKLFESMGDALVVLDDGGNVVAANVIATALLLENEPIGKSASAVFGDDIAERVARIGDDLVAGDSRALSVTLPAPGKAVLDLLISWIVSERGVHLMVVGRDRSREHHLGESVRSTNEFLRSLVTSSADPIVATTPDGTINYFSPGAVEIFGWSHGQVRGTAVAIYYGGGEATARRVMRDLRKQEKIHNRLVRFLHSEGMLIDCSLSASLLRDRNGEVIGTVGVVKDVSGQRRAEKARARKEALAARGAIAAQIGHQVRNMLAVMQGRVQLSSRHLEAGDIDRASRDLRAVEDEIAKLAAVSEDLMSSGGGQSAVGPIELGELLARLLESLRATRRFRGRKIVFEEPKGPLPVHARARVIETIVANLLENASDASPEEAPIELRCLERDARAHLEVLDRGSGVPIDLADKIMAPRFTTKSKGHGLGLPLARRLAAEIGGELGFRERAGGGTVFWVELPLSSVAKGRSRPLLTF